MSKIIRNAKTTDLANDSITYLQGQTSYEKALLKIAFVRTQNELKPYWGTIELFHKSDKVELKEERYDYGSILMVSYLLTKADILNFLKSVAETKTIKLPDGAMLKFEEYGESMFLYSNEDYGYAQKHLWPCNNLLLRFPFFNIEDPNMKLVKRGLPLYPYLHTAVKDFLKLENALTGSSDTSRYLLIQMPDFRMRITGVTISGNKIKLTIENKDVSYNSLVTKIYMENRSSSYKSEDLKFDESKTISCKTDFEPATINICILDESDNIVDARDINLTWFRHSSDVKIEIPSLQIREIALRGENENVEFKREMSKTDNKVLETITALANGNGGIILIGVEDDTTICGWEGDFNKMKDSLRDSITNRIEPRGIKYDVDLIKMDESEFSVERKSVVVIRIFEGQDKPYRLLDKGFLLRQGSSNRPMTRYELDEIYQKKGSNNPLIASQGPF